MIYSFGCSNGIRQEAMRMQFQRFQHPGQFCIRTLTPNSGFGDVGQDSVERAVLGAVGHGDELRGAEVIVGGAGLRQADHLAQLLTALPGPIGVGHRRDAILGQFIFRLALDEVGRGVHQQDLTLSPRRPRRWRSTAW